MKKKPYMFFLLLVISFLSNCSSFFGVKNSEGYIIKHHGSYEDMSFGNYSPVQNTRFKDVSCNGETAWVFFVDTPYRVFLDDKGNYFVKSGYSIKNDKGDSFSERFLKYNSISSPFVVEKSGRGYKVNIEINEIIPLSIAIKKFDNIVKRETQYNSFIQYATDIENQRLKAKQKIEQERIRLARETDIKYGVISVISISDIEKENLFIGTVYRISSALTIVNKYDSTSYIVQYGHKLLIQLLGSIYQFIITDIIINEINKLNIVQYWTVEYGRIGYIVRYLGQKQAITQGGFLRMVPVFQYVGANIYIDSE